MPSYLVLVFFHVLVPHLCSYIIYVYKRHSFSQCFANPAAQCQGSVGFAGRRGKGLWATPHSYLLWWALCILLHSPCINESAVKEQMDMWNKLLFLALLSWQKVPALPCLSTARCTKWGAVNQADKRHSMGSGAEPLKQGSCTPRLALHIFQMKARTCSLLLTIIFKRSINFTSPDHIYRYY